MTKRIILFSLFIFMTYSGYSQSRISSFGGSEAIDRKTIFDNIIVNDDVVYYINVERGIGAFIDGISSITVYKLEDEILNKSFETTIRRENGVFPNVLSYGASSDIYSKDNLYLVYNRLIIAVDLETGKEVEYKVPEPFFIPYKNIKVKDDIIYSQIYNEDGDIKMLQIEEETSELGVLNNSLEGYGFIDFRPGFNFLLSNDSTKFITYNYSSEEVKIIYDGNPIKYLRTERSDDSDEVFIIDAFGKLLRIDLLTMDETIYCNEGSGEAVSFSVGDNFMLVERLTSQQRRMDYYELPICNVAVTSFSFESNFGLTARYSHFAKTDKEFAYVELDLSNTYIVNEKGDFKELDVAFGPPFFNFETYVKENVVYRLAYDENMDGVQLWGIDLEKGKYFLGNKYVDYFLLSNPMKLVFDPFSSSYYTAGINIYDGVELYRYNSNFELDTKFSVKPPYLLASIENIYNRNDTIFYLVNDSLFQVCNKSVKYLTSAKSKLVKYQNGKIVWLERKEENFQFRIYDVTSNTISEQNIPTELSTSYKPVLLETEFVISSGNRNYFYDQKGNALIDLEEIRNPKQYSDFIIDIDFEDDYILLKSFNINNKSFAPEMYLKAKNLHVLGNISNKLFLTVTEENNSRKIYSVNLQTQEIEVFQYEKDVFATGQDVLLVEQGKRIVVKSLDNSADRLDIISLNFSGMSIASYANYKLPGFGLSITEMGGNYILNDSRNSDFIHVIDGNWESVSIANTLSPGYFRSIYYLKESNQLLAAASVKLNEVIIEFLNLENLEIVDKVILDGYTAVEKQNDAFYSLEGNLLFTLSNDAQGEELISFDQDLGEINNSYEVNKGLWPSNASNYQIVDSILYFDAIGLPSGQQLYYLENILGATKTYEEPIIEEEEPERDPIGVIFPNPTSNYISIDFILKDAIVYNSLGEATYVGLISPFEMIGIENFSSGVYFLTGTNVAADYITLKFVVQ